MAQCVHEQPKRGERPAYKALQGQEIESVASLISHSEI
jgi:hypothetical protein